MQGPSEDAAGLMSSLPSPATPSMDKRNINSLQLQFKHAYVLDVVLCMCGIYCTSIYPKGEVTFPTALPQVSSSSQKSFFFFKVSPNPVKVKM